MDFEDEVPSKALGWSVKRKCIFPCTHSVTLNGRQMAADEVFICAQYDELKLAPPQHFHISELVVVGEGVRKYSHPYLKEMAQMTHEKSLIPKQNSPKQKSLTSKQIRNQKLAYILKEEKTDKKILTFEREVSSQKKGLIVFKGCYESEPCCHSVVLDGQVDEYMDSTEIYAAYVTKGLKVPHHFQVYNPETYTGNIESEAESESETEIDFSLLTIS